MMKYFDVFDLWNKANGVARRTITQEELQKASGVTRPTLMKMKNGGGNSDPVKVAAVAEALYKLSGLKRPKKLVIAWLDDAPEPESAAASVETGHALSLQPGSAETTHAPNP